MSGFARVLLLFAVVCAAKASIILPGSFGPDGDVGFATSGIGSDAITFGDGNGYIYQMDAFLNVDGTCDYGTGVSEDLACGPPAGINYTFSESQPTSDQLLLNYTFVNNTNAVISQLNLIYFVDADIGTDVVNEWATVNGSVGDGVWGYQVGDPTYSSIVYNAVNNVLSNTNQEPATSPGDVAFALGLTDESVAVGAQASFQIMLSDNETSIGTLQLTQFDPVYTGDTLTVSGVGVPEPSTVVLGALGFAILFIRTRRARVG